MLKQNLHMNVYNNSIHVFPKPENHTNISFYRWMDDQTMVHPHKGMLLSNKKEWTNGMILKSILLDGKSQPRQVTYFITPLFLENMNPYFKKEKIEILNVYTSENIMCMYFTTKYL